jgi:hypothetical protein
MLSSTFKNAPAYYNAGVVAVNSKVVGLAPGNPEFDLAVEKDNERLRVVPSKLNVLVDE